MAPRVCEIRGCAVACLCLATRAAGALGRPSSPNASNRPGGKIWENSATPTSTAQSSRPVNRTRNNPSQRSILLKSRNGRKRLISNKRSSGRQERDSPVHCDSASLAAAPMRCRLFLHHPACLRFPLMSRRSRCAQPPQFRLRRNVTCIPLRATIPRGP
jgi:hypothetical protein